MTPNIKLSNEAVLIEFVLWLEDNIDCESGLHFDNDERVKSPEVARAFVAMVTDDYLATQFKLLIIEHLDE